MAKTRGGFLKFSTGGILTEVLNLKPKACVRVSVTWRTASGAANRKWPSARHREMGLAFQLIVV